MRITGGKWRGRRLHGPGGEKVRPTQDRVREALFSMIAPALANAVFVDLCAGTGIVGLEALSRGAAATVWVERDREAWLHLCRNVESLTGTHDGVRRMEALRWLRGPGAGARADIVFADPPYAWGAKGIHELIAAAEAAACPRSGGLLIVEQASDIAFAEVAGFEPLRDRRYGQSRLVVLRASEEKK